MAYPDRPTSLAPAPLPHPVSLSRTGGRHRRQIWPTWPEQMGFDSERHNGVELSVDLGVRFLVTAGAGICVGGFLDSSRSDPSAAVRIACPRAGEKVF